MADTMTKKEMDAYYADKGYYHKSDPRHPMNKEGTGPSVMIAIGTKETKSGKRKKMNKGGYAISGASVPATQKSTKMAYGGMARKK
jgi:hypothetical protein